MQLLAYQNEGMCHLAAATALAWCAEERLVTTLAAHFPGSGGSTWLSSTINLMTWLPVILHKMLAKKLVLKMCFHGCMRII